MARHVYFAFHYQRDIFRVNQVRNSWLCKPDRIAAGFYDDSLWESSMKTGDEAIKRMIRNGLVGTSVTAVLVGYETWKRRWVKFEIEESVSRGNGILAVHIANLNDINGKTDPIGSNPLDYTHISLNGSTVAASSFYRTYWWFSDDGYENFGRWVEDAARQVGR